MAWGLGARLVGLLCGVLALAPVPSWGQQTLRGVALVIGQSDYESIADLPNAERDADAIETLLSDLGFTSSAVTDRDARRLTRDLDAFLDDAEGADVAVIYYGGHAVEIGGENYLVPTDADVSSPKALAGSLISLSEQVSSLQTKAKVTIVLLDACRDNPFPAGTTIIRPGDDAPVVVTSTGLQSRGVVAMTHASAAKAGGLGIVVGFAAEPGKAALDGEPGTNSPYAAALLRHIGAMSGDEFGTVMRMVAEEVYLKTGGRQRPWINESLRRLLFLGGKEPSPAADEGAILQERRRLLVTISSLPDVERQRIRRIAEDGGVPMDALFGMLKAMGSDAPADPVEFEKLLRRRAEEIKSLVSERDMIKSSDPELVRLARLTELAIREGAIAQARHFRELVDRRIDVLDTSLDKVEADILDRRREIAAEYARSAKVAALAFDGMATVTYYRRAYEQVEGRDPMLAATYKKSEGEALLANASYGGGKANIEAALAALDDALPHIPAANFPQQWAEAQFAKLQALQMLAEQQSDAALIPSLEQVDKVFEELTASVWSKQADPQNWGSAKRVLARTIVDVADRFGNPDAYRSAVEHLEAAASIEIADAVDVSLMSWIEQAAGIDAETGWALRQLSLLQQETDALVTLEKARAKFVAALKVFTRGRHPAEWARYTADSALVLDELGRRKKDSALIMEAIDLVESALAEIPRERFPVNWATGHGSLGIFHGHLFDITSERKWLEMSESAYEDALQEISRANSPSAWAMINYNLGDTLTNYGIATKRTDYLKRAIEKYDNALTVFNAVASPRKHSQTLQMRANPTLALFEFDHSAANATLAYSAQTALLSLFDRNQNPQAWSRAASRAGYFLTERARLTADVADLTRAIGHLENALDVLDAGPPATYHRATKNMCSARVLEVKLKRSPEASRETSYYCASAFRDAQAAGQNVDGFDAAAAEAASIAAELADR